ncbi:MAG: enolase C-terminal domain-like protein [Spirochaetia bacterium]|nr:enolase C-terminal domain-like protein [Spirochaetia bacterium]
MLNLQAYVHALSIPFKLDFTHSQARRQASDSLIVELSDGEYSGFGEAVAREYVTGTSTADSTETAAVVRGILHRLPDADGSIDTLLPALLSSEWPAAELPLLCAVEGALLDLLCKRQKVDVYTLLQMKPRRRELIYGGTLPMLPLPAAEKMLGAYLQAGITNLRIKLARDTEYNRKVLEKARGMLGNEYDLRVDANAAWSVDETIDHLPLLQEFGISLIEEPLGRDWEGMGRVGAVPESGDFCFVADESAVSFQDVEQISQDASFGMINIRLSKHGGLLRSLHMARLAEENGLSYQLGCHVGETGILSGLGRVAASLMEQPVYVDGSYDRHLLSDNIITEDYTFGYGGKASIRRNQAAGYIVDTSIMEKLTSDYYACS